MAGWWWGRLLLGGEDHVTGGVDGGRGVLGAAGGGGVAVGGHVAVALQDLADDLVFSHARGDGVERGAAEAACAADGVAGAALLVLEGDRGFAFEGGGGF